MAKIPSARIDLARLAGRQLAALSRLDASIELDPVLSELVKLRASQLNGCAFCIDMHWKDARAAGEREERLYSLSAWRESPLYDERERAALELTEAITNVSDGHVGDAVWERARAAFPEDELAQLVLAITTINAWNRVAITARYEPGHHRAAAREVA